MQLEWILIWLFVLALLGTIAAVVVLVVIDNSTNPDRWG
jgi:hypothetical protein